MGLSAFQRRRELSGAGGGADQQAGKMQGKEEAKLKAKAAEVIAKGGLPNPADAEESVPSTPQLKGETEPSREAEEEWLSKHGAAGDDPPRSTEPGEEVEREPSVALPEPSMQVDKEGDSLVGEAKKHARSTEPPTVMGAAEGQEPKDRAFTQEGKGTVGKVAGVDRAQEEDAGKPGGKTEASDSKAAAADSKAAAADSKTAAADSKSAAADSRAEGAKPSSSTSSAKGAGDGPKGAKPDEKKG